MNQDQLVTIQTQVVDVFPTWWSIVSQSKNDKRAQKLEVWKF